MTAICDLVEPLLGGSRLGLTVNGPFRAAGASCWKGHPLRPSPHLQMAVLPRNCLCLPARGEGRWAAAHQRWGPASSPPAWAQPCNQAATTPSEVLGRKQAAYLSLISTSSHSGGGLSSSDPTAQTSEARGTGCPSSVCRLRGYSWPSHSSSESEEELSSELESSLDVVS